MKNIRDLIKARGDKLLARDWNDLVNEGRARCLEPGPVRQFVPDPDYFWKTSTARMDAERKWSVSVGPGWINDVVPTIPYLKTADPRGWVKPAGYVEPARGDRGFSEYFIERDLLEPDPPVLLIEAPVGEEGNEDFALVTDAQRIPYFRTEAMWPLRIFSAHVILVAAPLRATFFPASLPPPPLATYRLATVPRPLATTFAVLAGGWLELARLYLVRDDEAGPSGDRLLVQQREFRNLAATIVRPSISAGGTIDIPGSFGGIGAGFADAFATGVAQTYNAFVSQVQAEVDGLLEQTATVEFWSV